MNDRAHTTSEKKSLPVLNEKRSQSAFTLIGVVMILVLLGVLLSVGTRMIGTKVKRSKVVETKKIINAAVDSITSYGATNSKLPTTGNFTSTVSNPSDAWTKSLYYILDSNLTDTSVGGICGRKTTYLTLNICPDSGCSSPTRTITDVAFIILSGAGNYNNQTAGTQAVSSSTTINTYNMDVSIDAYTGDMDSAVPYDDMFQWITIDELRANAGCIVPRLRILNNELPSGYIDNPYSVTIYGDGGVPFSSGGNYRWCRQEDASSGLTFTPSTLSADCLNLAEASWAQADSIVISGTPPSASTYTYTFFIRDDNDASGISDSISQRTLVLTITTASGATTVDNLWIGHNGGILQYCDTSGTCTSAGDMGDHIYSMAVFDSKLWIGHNGGVLQSCDTSGTCTSAGDKGDDIRSMAVFDSKLWLGHQGGRLSSCNTAGTCTDHGDKGNNVFSMAVFDSKLWLGHGGGRLSSCNTAGTCTNEGDKGANIWTMAVFDSKLWIGQQNGNLRSCDTSGTCTNEGDKGDHIYSMLVFDTKLWIGHNGGILQSCDTSGTCTSAGDKGNDIRSMAEFDSKLWIGHVGGRLQSCNTTGTCTNYGDKGNTIWAMKVSLVQE